MTVRYTATPRRGLYFRTPELGYPAEDMHLFTQGEAVQSRDIGSRVSTRPTRSSPPKSPAACRRG